MMQPVKVMVNKIKKQLVFAAAALCLIAAGSVIAEETDPIQLQFEEALDDRESGKIYDAIRIFENILATNPYLNRARLELAVAYHEASLYEKAMEQFQIVLDDPETPESVRLAILAYIGQLESDRQEPEASHHFSQYVKAGLIYNSNINAVPGVGNIIVNNREFYLPIGEINSVGTDLVLSASHRYRRKKPFNVDGARTGFEWQSQASLSSNLYTETSDYNLNIISADTGPAFISTGRWLGAIPVRIDYVNLGQSSLATAFSINPYISFDLGNYRSILVESTFLTRDYADSINEPQDGNLVMAGAAYTALLHSLNTGIEAGFRLRDRSAEDDQFAYDGFTLYFSGYTSVTELSSVYLKANYRKFDYKAPDTILDENNTTLVRNDDEITAGIGYNLDIKDGFLGKWTLNTEIAYTENVSNIDAYDYDRWLVTLNLSRYFQ
jgi:tetratricopeptide (TPR) repeat protein